LIWIITVVVLVAVALGAAWLTKMRAKRIERIAAAVRAMSAGDLSARIPLSAAGDTAVLARSIHELRDHLAAQLGTIDRQRRTLESLLAQLHEGVLVVESAGRIILVNPEAVRLLRLSSPRKDGRLEGLPMEQCAVPHDIQELLTSPQTRQPLAAKNPTPQRGDPQQLEPHPAGREIQLRVDGSEGTIHLMVQAFDILLPGPTDGFASATKMETARMAVMTDVTELTRIMQVKTDFAANASHELRTPLSAIRAAVETLRAIDPTKDPKSAANFLDIIERHGRRMEAMVVDLLDLSRLESPSSRFESVTVRSRELLDELHNAFEDAIAGKRLHWAVDVQPGCELIRANPELLRLTLRNLVENAIRFTEAGGHVTVIVRRVEGAVSFEVVDDGCGIAPEEQGRVFERFYQVARARSGGERGTGLGLSIVRHAVAAMGGRVELSSTLGRGTRVTVLVPQPQVISRRGAAERKDEIPLRGAENAEE